MVKRGAVIPNLLVEADNLAQAHYRAMKAVYEKGMNVRTQYDRKDKDGNYIDPPSKDASVLIVVANPFNEPRFPRASFVHRGEYLGEMMGIKDHLVVPYAVLRKNPSGERPIKTWPYLYPQRLFNYPLNDGTFVNQMDAILDRLAKDPTTRRAVATTRVPEIDSFMADDLPCLGEIQFRCFEDGDGLLRMHMGTRWRSRDCFKGLPDNVGPITFWQQVYAKKLSERIGRPVEIGSYMDYNFSLHIYGQDMVRTIGKNALDFIEKSEENAVDNALTSEHVTENLIIPGLEDLLAPAKIEEWKFGRRSIEILEGLISDLKSGRLAA